MCKNIATGKTSQAITPFHFFDKFHFYDFLAVQNSSLGDLVTHSVLMGTLITPCFGPTALSSEGRDCSSEDIQKMGKTSSWVSESLNRKFR